MAVGFTGNAKGFALARRSLRPRGALVIKSTYAGKLALDASALVVDEIAVVGSRCGSFAPALRTLAAGRVEVESPIRVRFSLQDGLKASAKARERDCLKVLLNIGEI